MAVPPVPQARTAVPVRAVRVPLVLDVVAGLLTVVALPLAVVVIPNTVSLVAPLLPPGVSPVEMVRAFGLALPAMLLTVPLAAIAVGRFRAAPILLAGLALLALADAAGGYADSPGLAGVLRVLHGVGAGTLIPATLVVAAERRRNVLLPIWAGVLACSLLSAQALALWPLDDADSWQVALRPYPLLTGIALVLAAAYLVLWLIGGDGTRVGDPAVTRQASSERRRLALALIPATGLAALGIFLTFDWPATLVVATAAVAAIAVLAMLALGTFEGPGGRTLAFANVAVGLVVLPTAAQTTYIELKGLGGPGLKGLWLPLAVAAALALVSAVVTGMLAEQKVARFPGIGMATMVAGLCAIWWLVPEPSGGPLVVPFTLLAVGAAIALVSAFRLSGVGSGLLGLSMCFPAVLAGFLLGTGIQVLMLKPIRQSGQATQAEMLDVFTNALDRWVWIGGAAVVGIILLTEILSHRASATSRDAAPAASDATGTAPAHGRDQDGPAQVMIPAPTPSPEGDKGTAGDTGRDG